jgi:hypothetical protein
MHTQRPYCASRLPDIHSSARGRPVAALNGETRDISVLPERYLNRELLPGMDTHQLPDPYRRSPVIWPPTDRQRLDDRASIADIELPIRNRLDLGLVPAMLVMT